MAHRYAIISNATYTGYTIPDNLAVYLGLPIVTPPEDDSDPVAINYTPQEAFEQASLGSAPAFAIEERDGQAPLRGEDINTVTDWIKPLNNTSANFDEIVIGLATAAGVPYREVWLGHSDIQHYLATGESPESLV